MSLTLVPKEFAWENKYRPDNLDEIILPKDIKNRLHGFIATGNGKLPSMLFYSQSPGTGKTTTARAMANEVGCPQPLFINASLKTSIDDIRDLVATYAQGKSVLGGTKIVILDEVERLSTAAQESLKGLIEAVSTNCSFILTTNAKMRVVEPLRSRCREIDFVWSAEESKEMMLAMMKRVAEVLVLENVTDTDEKKKAAMPVIAKVVQKYFPDNRKIMGMFQDSAATYGAVDERTLAFLTTTDLSTVVQFMKDKKWIDMKQWVSDNQNNIDAGFYGRFFRYLVPQDPNKAKMVENASVLDLVAICQQAQVEHGQVADLWLHGVAFFSNVMNNIKWS